MRRYKQFSLEERRKIEKWQTAKIRVDVITEHLGLDRSTIFRVADDGRKSELIWTVSWQTRR